MKMWRLFSLATLTKMYLGYFPSFSSSLWSRPNCWYIFTRHKQWEQRKWSNFQLVHLDQNLVELGKDSSV